MSKTVRAAGKALDTLVTQFAQPLACLRELVQNSIDARTNRIEIELRQSPADKCYILSVSDTGEGMTRDIVESQLTRLFASSKENDLTKVGKFGIGFVSVFALEPQAVVVDTGRDGQSWRVLFGPERDYQLIASDQHLEGTCVSLYLNSNRWKFTQLEKDVRSTLAFWCRHCRTEIIFQGQSLSEPFELEADFTHHYEESGTRLVLALANKAQAPFGYYNQGLTLLEGEGGPLPFLSFKLDSRYFEHTLTRDNLIENEDYQKAQRILRREALEVYPQKLFERLRQDPQSDLWKWLLSLKELGVSWYKEALFPDLWGTFHSLESLQKGQVFFQDQPTALAEAVHSPRGKIWVFPEHPSMLNFLKENAVPVQSLQREWGLSQEVRAQAGEELWQLFLKLAKAATSRRPILVQWQGSQEQLPFLWIGPIGAVRWSQSAGPKDPIQINVGDPLLGQLQRLAAWNQNLAAQVLVQHLLLLEADNKREQLALKITEMSLSQL